jgi:hypothetical protein
MVVEDHNPPTTSPASTECSNIDANDRQQRSRFLAVAQESQESGRRAATKAISANE